MVTSRDACTPCSTSVVSSMTAPQPAQTHSPRLIANLCAVAMITPLTMPAWSRNPRRSSHPHPHQTQYAHQVSSTRRALCTGHDTALQSGGLYSQPIPAPAPTSPRTGAAPDHSPQLQLASRAAPLVHHWAIELAARPALVKPAVTAVHLAAASTPVPSYHRPAQTSASGCQLPCL